MKQKSYIRKTPKNKAGFTFSIIHKVFPFIVLLVFMQISTQKLSRALNYDSEIMGKPLLLLHGNPVYPFYAILRALVFSAIKGNLVVGNIIYDNSKLLLLGSIAAAFSYYILSYLRNLLNENDKNFLTTNRIGNYKDLKNSGLLADRGVVIGQLYSSKIDATMEGGSCKLNVIKTAQLIQYYTNVCGMLMAGTRLGKGVSTVSLPL